MKKTVSILLALTMVLTLLSTTGFALSNVYNVDYTVTTSGALTTGTPSSYTSLSNASGTITIQAEETGLNECDSNDGVIGNRTYATNFSVAEEGAIWMQATTDQKLLSVRDIQVQVVENENDGKYYMQVYFTGDAAGIPANESYGYVDIYLDYYFSTNNGVTWYEQTLITSVYVYPADPVSYTVTYTDGDDNDVVFADEKYEVEAGDPTPEFKQSTDRDGYTFLGWDPDVADTVEETVTYVAQWEEEETTTSTVIHSYGDYEWYATGASAGVDTLFDESCYKTSDSNNIILGTLNGTNDTADYANPEVQFGSDATQTDLYDSGVLLHTSGYELTLSDVNMRTLAQGDSVVTSSYYIVESDGVYTVDSSSAKQANSDLNFDIQVESLSSSGTDGNNVKVTFTRTSEEAFCDYVCVDLTMGFKSGVLSKSVTLQLAYVVSGDAIGETEVVPDPVTTYTVDYTDDGDTLYGATVTGLPENATVEAGTTITMPSTNPSKANDYSWTYVFEEWVITDAEGNELATLTVGQTYTVTSDITVSAVFDMPSLDGDDDWDVQDYQIMRNWFISGTALTPEQEILADIDNDGDVDANDYQTFRNWYLYGTYDLSWL